MAACEHQISDNVNQNIDGDRATRLGHSRRMTGKVVNKPLGDRVKVAREGAGLTQSRLASEIGVKQTAIAEIEGGRVRRPKNLHEIAQHTGKTVEWLLGQEPEHIDSENILGRERGEPDFPPDPQSLKASRKMARRQLAPGELPEIDINGSLGPGGIGETLMVDGREVDSIRATWRLPVSYLHSELRAAESDVDIIPVEGDSMIPTLIPGDRVLINRRQQTPASDGLYAIGSMYGVQVKRIELVPGRADPPLLRIISDNPAHRTNEVTVDEIRIIGRVICRISRM